MLEKLYIYPFAAPRLRSSPLGPWLDSFVRQLGELGYTPWSLRSNVVLAADFGRWMTDHELSVGGLNESAVDAYLAARETQRERRRAAASLMLAHLRAEGVTPSPSACPDSSAVAVLAQRYAAYMRKERGAAEGTIEGYIAVFHEFLVRRFGTGELDLMALSASDVGKYLTERAPTLAPKRVAYLASALRSFFRFLFVHGETTTDMATAALMPLTRHQAAVARYLSPEDVGKLLGSCDPRTPKGRRNAAILLLLVRLGLRAAEVAALELNDIRWRSAEIVVRGKGNVVARLPLTSEVGSTLTMYLQKDRPVGAPTRRLFIRLCAPVRELGGRSAVSTIVRTALKKAGLEPAARGAHLLRHTLGTRLLRSGASMAEIAEVLRHHSTASTAIYAKVDIEALRSLAQPWPSVGGA